MIDENMISDEASVNDLPENTYMSVRGYVIDAQRQVYSAVNSAMVSAYWNIGREIYQAYGENERAEYGKQVLQLYPNG